MGYHHLRGAIIMMEHKREPYAWIHAEETLAFHDLCFWNDDDDYPWL